MKRILIWIAVGMLACYLTYGQKTLPTFAQYSEHFLNTGDCDEVFVQGNFVYSATDAGLLILDISDVEDPKVVSCFYTDGSVHRFYIRDNIAYFTSEKSSYTTVYIIDVSDPQKPVLINSFETDTSSTNESILVEDDVLYLGMSYKGLYIYDIVNLHDPVLITKLPDISPTNMVKVDSIIYMAANIRYLGLLDVSDISKPSVLSWTHINTFRLTGIDVVESNAYLSGDHLFVYDISNPDAPNILSEIGQESLIDLVIKDSIVYTISEDSLYRINVINPEMPKIINTSFLHATHINIDSELLAASKGYSSIDPYGISLYDIGDINALEMISEYYSDHAKEFFVKDDYAYIANGYSGFFILSIADPSHPVLCSSILEGIHVLDVLIRDTLAFIRTHQGFQIINIMDPYNPYVISKYNLSHSYYEYAYYSIGVYNDHVYIGGNGFSEIYVFDVSNLYDPVHIGYIDVADWSPGISVFEDLLYVGGYWGGLEIFDIGEDPISPDRLSHYPLAFAFKVCPAENRVFVDGALDESTYGTLMFHLPDPTNPVYTGNHPAGAYDLYYADSYLFTPYRDYLDLNSSIHIVNVQNIYNFYLEQEVPGVAANAVWFEDDILYAAEDFKFKIFGDSVSVSVEENSISEAGSDILIYPNPANESIAIRSMGEAIHKIQLIDISGKMVIERSTATNHFSMDVSELNPGIYFVRIFEKKNIYCRKIVVH